jgi:uncharacterized protein
VKDRRPPVALRLVVRLLWPCLALLVSACAPAQDPAGATARPNERPFFWRVDGAVPSYLFGTIHLPDERATDVHPAVDRALADCDALFTELEMDKMMSPALVQAMRLPAGKTLRDYAPPELVARVLRRLGIPAEAEASVLGMRPWALSFQVMLRPKPGAGEALDLMIYKDAKSAGKEVGGLETIQEQLDAITSLGIEGEVDLLQTTLDVLDDYERRGLDVCEQMMQAYCAGDAPRLLAFFDEMQGETDMWQRLSRTLLTDRNLHMAERIDRKLQAEPQHRFVFAVGTGHLIGATNVVDLLRARGYTVTRVPETAANLDEEIELLLQQIDQRQQRIRQLQERRTALPTASKKAG